MDTCFVNRRDCQNSRRYRNEHRELPACRRPAWPHAMRLLAVVVLMGLAGCQPAAQSGKLDAFTETPSGLRYRMRVTGRGAKARPDDLIRVRFRGWLPDGTVFRDSWKEEQSPVDIDLSQMIPGWKEGVSMLREGGVIELIVPPELGYGEEGSANGIPANSDIHFIVELVEIVG